jgi:asparagine N-glycosylation enzyme membrane subunit Stt3
MQETPPPPMMSMRGLLDSRRIGIGLVVLGLLFMMAGALAGDASQNIPATETAEQTANRENLGRAWAPALGHIGAFFFVSGLLLMALFVQAQDIFVRLFLLILAFLALLLVLANSSTLFGPRL